MALIRFLTTLLLTYVALFIVCTFAVVGALALLICAWGTADSVIVRVLDMLPGNF